MKNFRRFALLSMIAAYILIFVGGLVRVSGAGLGCPDWPTCFGRWIPPTNVSQLPPEIDPAQFNFTLAWIEYINRLIGIIVGLLITIMTILAIKNYRKTPVILMPSILAFLLVAYQGWQGGQVVTSKLEPFVVSQHTVIALVIVGLLVYIFQKAGHLANPEPEKMSLLPAKTGLWITALWIALIAQIALGTHVRSVLVPEKGPAEAAVIGLPGPVTSVDFFHPLLGIVIGIYTLLFGFSVLRRGQNLSRSIKDIVIIMIIAVIAQIALGVGQVMTGVPGLMQILHLWLASAYVGMLIFIQTEYRRSRKAVNAVA